MAAGSGASELAVNSEHGTPGRGRVVTVFGATGFLGHRVVRHLLDRGFKVWAASRHPERMPSSLRRDLMSMEPIVIFPLFGMGQTRLQPVHVDDVAEAIARILGSAAGVGHPCYELGGPRSYTYAELLRSIADRIGTRARLLPVPFTLWHATALASETMLGATLTRGQVALMRHDNLASQELPGVRDLNIAPAALEDVVLAIVEGKAARH